MTINPAMISMARESRGFNQTELANKMDVSVSTASRLEFGNINAEEYLDLLSDVLNYPKSFFSQNFSIQPPNVHYRKRLTLSPKTLRKADAQMNIYRGNIEKMLNTITLEQSNLPIIVENKYASPKKLAMYLRSFWSVPKGAIKDLVTLVEKHGIIVILFDFETDKIDGRSMMTEDGHPVIFLNKFFPGERQRLTLAHELGHICMHLETYPTYARDEEAEAFEFASEFLMPEYEIRYDLSQKLTLEKLADLKRVWKVSMGAILYWAEKLNCISPNQSRYLWSQYSANGYKRTEPLAIPLDQPTLFNRLINIYMQVLGLKDDNVSKEEIAKIFCLNIDEFLKKVFSTTSTLRIA